MNRIKELRQKEKVSLAKLSKALKDDYSINASPQTLMRYEKEETQPKLDIFKAIADYFKVDVGYLQGFASTPKIPSGSVIRKYDSSLKKIVNADDDLPDDTSIFQLEMDELLSYNAKRVTPLLHSLFPKPLAEEWDENLVSYADRANYFMAMQTASSAFLALLEQPTTPTKNAVSSMIFEILTSIDDLYADNSLDLKSFIREMNKVQKQYTSPENYENNEVPWEIEAQNKKASDDKPETEG